MSSSMQQQGGNRSDDEKKLKKILDEYDGKEGDAAQLIREMCDKIRDEFERHNVVVIHDNVKDQLRTENDKAKGHCQIKDRQRGQQKYEARVFERGTLSDARNLQGRDDQLTGYANWEQQGDKVVFRRVQSDSDRKRLDLNQGGSRQQ